MRHKAILEATLIPEWKSKYLAYDGLQQRMRHAVRQIQSAVKTLGRARRQHFELLSMGVESGPSPVDSIKVDENAAHIAFVEELAAEIRKVDSFYCSQLADAEAEFKHLVQVCIRLNLITHYHILPGELLDAGSTMFLLLQAYNLPVTALQLTTVDSSERKEETNDALKPVSFRTANDLEALMEAGWDDDMVTQGVEMSDAVDDGAELESEHELNGLKDTGALWSPHAGSVYAENSSSAVTPKSVVSKDSQNGFSMGLFSFQLGAADTSDLSAQKHGSQTNDVEESKEDSGESEETAEPPASARTIPESVYVEREVAANEVKAKARIAVQADFIAYYHHIALIKRFGEQNTTSLRKLFKKHRKELGGRIEKTPEVHEALSKAAFYITDNQKIQQLCQETEQLYISAFVQKNSGDKTLSINERKKKGMNELRTQFDDEAYTAMGMFRFGVYFGICIACLFTLIHLEASFPNDAQVHGSVESWAPMIRMYRLSGCCILLSWAWAFNFFVFNKCRVNYVLILEFDRKRSITAGQMLEFSTLFTVLWMLMITASTMAIKETPHSPDIMTDYLVLYPTSLLLLCVVAFLVMQWRGSGWFLKCLYNIVRSGFVPVALKDFYIADQLTSLSIILVDIEYVACYLGTGSWHNNDSIVDHVCEGHNRTVEPYIAMLPSLWRLLQCIRRWRDSGDGTKANPRSASHLWNALKYATVFPVVLFGALYAASDEAENEDRSTSYWRIWLFFATIAVLFKYYWDIYHDFGLSPSNGFMRADKERHLYYEWFYPFISVLNLVLRCGWCLSLTQWSVHTDILSTCVACSEVLRRGLWNLLRLENEHINNAGNFRASSYRMFEKDRPAPTLTES